MKKTVLGIKIDDLTIDQSVEIALNWLSKRGKYYLSPFYITTPNPEIVMMAQKDIELKNILNNADLSVPDGMGLKLSGQIESLTPGVDLMEQIIKRSVDYSFTIGLLGGGLGVAEKAAERLRKKYPGVKIVYTKSGGEVDQQGRLLKSLKLPKLDILFVGFGPPKQEKWIAKNLSKIPVKVAMAVGGSLDYLSGTIPRAPFFLRQLGFEWLFRLMLQPWRIKRQLVLAHYLYKLLTANR